MDNIRITPQYSCPRVNLNRLYRENYQHPKLHKSNFRSIGISSRQTKPNIPPHPTRKTFTEQDIPPTPNIQMFGSSYNEAMTPGVHIDMDIISEM